MTETQTQPAGGAGAADATRPAVRRETGQDGVAVVTLDDPARSVNTMNEAYLVAMEEVLDGLAAAKGDLRGVVVTSAKKTFFAGADLAAMQRWGRDDAAAVFAHLTRIKGQLRRLETLGLPVVAVLNGTALGGGLEIALACHRRIAVDAPGAVFGLPEVGLGLLPGAGGVTRVTRMLGVADGLTKVMLEGRRHKPAAALGIGLVDELVGSREEALDRARAWLDSGPEPRQPWEAPGYRIPGGTPATPQLAAVLPAFPARLRKQLRGAPLPAPRNILAAAVEGAQVDVDTALRIETRYFVELATGQVAKNMTKAFFFDTQAIAGGASRPAGYERWAPTRVAVLGAGMMGAGIAYVCAQAGWEVVLKDVSAEAAAKGRGYSEGLVARGVQRGRTTEEKGAALLARITPTDDYADLAGCDLVIEAVFESAALKKEVFAEVAKVVAPDALLCSNTSTLPITGLAEGVDRPADFAGLHFFSPVDRMPLIEIVRGRATADATIAKAFDVAVALRKTPIVVNDGRGFFTSRVITTFLNEGVAMLAEGIDPQTVEQASSRAGYPAPVLQLLDELTLSLALKIRDEARAAAGEGYVPHPAEPVLDRMVTGFGRKGRSTGGGFYEYEDGRRTRLWPGLRAELGATDHDVDVTELAERLLVVEAVETQRCRDDGVLTTDVDANVGSLLGIGYPPWTGGVVQYVEGHPGGVAGFVARADALADRYGERFRVPESLRSRASGSA